MAEREGGGAWGFYTTSAPDAGPHASSRLVRLFPTVIAKIQEGMNTRPLNQRLGFRNGIARVNVRPLLYERIAAGLAAVLLAWPGWPPQTAVAQQPTGTFVSWGNQITPWEPTGARYKAIAAGAEFSLALRWDGVVVAWGDDTYGQSGVPADLGGVIAIAAGGSHSLALKRDGTVVAWGAGGPGQAGDQNYGQATVPSGLSGVVAIAAGGSHSLALRQDGTVVAWGLNGNGQASVPTGLSGVIAIAAGAAYSLALQQDGTVVAWGDNYYGEATVPADLMGRGVVAIAAGPDHALALQKDGTVVAWGLGGPGGQPGYPNCGQATVPSGLGGVVAIAAGYLHSLALKQDGTVVAWGAGWQADGQDYGQAAVLTVVAAPSLTALPTNRIASAGATVDFAVEAAGTAPLAYQWLFNRTNALTGATNAILELTSAQAGQSGAYDVLVTNLGGAVASPPAVLTVMAPPSLVSMPVSYTTYAGASIEFAVGAVGAPPLGYQWCFNATNALADATNAVLDLADVQLSQAGVYVVVVTNPFGAVTSAPATLAFAGPVVIEPRSWLCATR